MVIWLNILIVSVVVEVLDKTHQKEHHGGVDYDWCFLGSMILNLVVLVVWISGYAVTF